MSFDKDIRDIMKMMGMSSRMTPVKDVYEARNTDLLSVVRIKKKTWKSFFGKMWASNKEDYSVTQYKLKALLQDGDAVDFGSVAHDDFVEISHETNLSVDLDVGGTMSNGIVDAGVQIGVDVKRSTSNFKLQLKSQKLHEIFDGLESRGKNEKLIQRLRGSSSVSLGFVYEVLRSPGPLSLHASIRGEGSLRLKLAHVSKVEASASEMVDKKVTLPSNSTVAFAVFPLDFADSRSGTEERSLVLHSDGYADWELTGNFKVTQEKLEAEFRVFGDLSAPVKKHVGELMFRILSGPQTLHPLDWMLEEGCVDEDNLSRVTEELQPTVKELMAVIGLFPAGSAKANDLLRPLNLLVGALADLDEEAVAMIGALEPNVLQELFRLIEGVMEKACSGEAAAPSQWRNQYSDGTCRVAEEVLKASEVVLDKDQLDPSEWTPDGGLLSLYIALRGLTMLLRP